MYFQWDIDEYTHMTTYIPVATYTILVDWMERYSHASSLHAIHLGGSSDSIIIVLCCWNHEDIC